MKRIIHLKTGNIYYMNTDIQGIINATNAQDGQRMILYCNRLGQYFVREENEFRNKFRIASESEFEEEFHDNGYFY